MNTVKINGINIQSDNSRNVTIKNGRVIVDGKDVTPEAKNITIAVEGNIDSLSVDECNSLDIIGSVGSVKTMSGDVHCDDITGSVTTMSGDVRCGNIGGNVSTLSGDVK